LEFELYCDDAWKKGLLGTGVMLGSLFSQFLFGMIADNYGRKLSL